MNRKTDRKRFILASASPRRKLLLERAGYVFDVIPSDIDESVFCTGDINPDPLGHTKQLALAKAKDVAKRFPDRLVMGADTVVDFDGRIVGKPSDAADAERITRLLFSKPHKVITAVSLVNIAAKVEIVEAEVTTVHPKKLTEQQIAGHIKNGNWQGKAGAYGIQETADEFVKKIDGSFTNVMGLPMELVGSILQKFGY